VVLRSCQDLAYIPVNGDATESFRVNLWSENELVLLTITEDVNALYTHLSRYLAAYSATDYAAYYAAYYVICYVAYSDIERR
jgi:hypothetical protein